MKNYSRQINLECISCGKCKSSCVMLDTYNVNPKEYFGEPSDTAIIPYSCMMCGLCEKVCPKSLHLGDGFMEMRNDLVHVNNGKIPLKQLGSVEMHQRLSFFGFFTAIGKGTKK